ncbi:hypothetical protein I7I53_01933 [Histoplasma capsulatum var. duboisii H88]|uniref:Uncharacterized protein n=1 Tax=Ajellomyces capsulatus (strain H88) TaxID=544711 RepID=A0A8A1LKM0_AJEC8|nr:hypothetical protein I7I53_01933 [Histoplasma capsulatum var. duboisii H88]
MVILVAWPSGTPMEAPSYSAVFPVIPVNCIRVIQADIIDQEAGARDTGSCIHSFTEHSANVAKFS